MNNDKQSRLLAPSLQPGEIYILDAPGLGVSIERLTRHVETGGKILHKMRPDENGVLQPVDPTGMWPRHTKQEPK